MKAQDFIASDPNNFAFGAQQTFTRLRRTQVKDPYDPDHTTLSGWEKADQEKIVGMLSSKSSVEQDDATRSEVISTAQFVSDDPAIDIQRGDRLQTSDGRIWNVVGYPTCDQNVFTGWQPTLVASLEEVIG
ncbi:hypothetical protein OZX73_05365 [Bifidobacterium sp. ESL0775]|uniref:hypothetical protein n=1 Tax=Bifidobacterium sp. ESL0775 TaxID=2983230 RepID=UPI0023F8FCCF|nr:hypothetical protein [Bifidobacterium sp. ESL0775]WEV68721.1 hypothetical protein OZX73_05365 [Bifidobacterium sp. ESL0775]